ncbi:hypothetical protein [Scytonema sp. UIC 10036]|uniref:hypothetical protein n=1 Tax=Scytonema sp. UIC 10036 TaxID=2304196 RepID=UPI001A9AF415|nr:hypothetical protein [Scytonema sp. UIC 10036]
MDFEEAFKVADAAVFAKTNRHLKDIETAMLRAAWQRKKYDEIAETQGYTSEYLKHDVGPKLWKCNFRSWLATLLAPQRCSHPGYRC